MKTLSSIQIVLTSLTFILGATLLGLSVNNYYTAISWWHVSFPFHPPGEPQNRKRFAWYGVNIRWNRFDLSPTFWSIGAGATCFSLSLLALLAGFVRPKMSLSTHSRWGRLLDSQLSPQYLLGNVLLNLTILSICLPATCNAWQFVVSSNPHTFLKYLPAWHEGIPLIFEFPSPYVYSARAWFCQVYNFGAKHAGPEYAFAGNSERLCARNTAAEVLVIVLMIISCISIGMYSYSWWKSRRTGQPVQVQEITGSGHCRHCGHSEHLLQRGSRQSGSIITDGESLADTESLPVYTPPEHASEVADLDKKRRQKF